jgi:hypothetical protein
MRTRIKATIQREMKNSVKNMGKIEGIIYFSTKFARMKFSRGNSLESRKPPLNDSNV